MQNDFTSFTDRETVLAFIQSLNEPSDEPQHKRYSFDIFLRDKELHEYAKSGHKLLGHEAVSYGVRLPPVLVNRLEEDWNLCCEHMHDSELDTERASKFLAIALEKGLQQIEVEIQKQMEKPQ